ncbi:hypothetical protein GCM10022247_35180 [Allokutzneria multivorans]|uniref:XRE family transcriptional regulator n=1 Tax=Allokutzneria multivorans TaxID=1142134 RepID=A0ABP7SCK2_9PSEU
MAVAKWTGREARALRDVLRMNADVFAEHLGIGPRAVSEWDRRGSDIVPRFEMQSALDTALAQATEAERHAFYARIAQPATAPPLALVGMGQDDEAFLAALDEARLRLDTTLTTGSLTPARLQLFERRVSDHLADYPRTSPAVMLRAIGPDLNEVQHVAAERQRARDLDRLHEILAVLSLLSADALMKLGDLRRSRYWYDSACLAADDTTNLALRAQVRAQCAMLPYYYGDTAASVRLARDAQALGAPSCDGVALAAAAEARGLARLGDRSAAEAALARAHDHLDNLPGDHPDLALKFTLKRYLLYASGTLTYLGEHARASDVQDQALQLYRSDPRLVIDPALIQLDHATGKAAQGEAEDACTLAITTLTGLPTEHRTDIVRARARDIITALPAQARSSRSVGELRDLLTDDTGSDT